MSSVRGLLRVEDLRLDRLESDGVLEEFSDLCFIGVPFEPLRLEIFVGGEFLNEIFSGEDFSCFELDCESR